MGTALKQDLDGLKGQPKIDDGPEDRNRKVGTQTSGVVLTLYTLFKSRG